MVIEDYFKSNKALTKRLDLMIFILNDHWRSQDTNIGGANFFFLIRLYIHIIII